MLKLQDWVNKIDWMALSINPNAIELLQENPDKIDWMVLSYNPSISTYDYEHITTPYV